LDEESDIIDLQMLEAQCSTGTRLMLFKYINHLNYIPLGGVTCIGKGCPRVNLDFGSDHILNTLQKIINSPPDRNEEHTRLKKDIFHAFHMIPTSLDNGLRPAFLRALQDHTLRWDPIAQEQVDRICHEAFHITFDQMLQRNPCWIKERTPHHAPSPSVLVRAIQFVVDTFGDAVDARGNPLFSNVTGQRLKVFFNWLVKAISQIFMELLCTRKLGLINMACKSGCVCVEPIV
jgi:hypothetical protein